MSQSTCTTEPLTADKFFRIRPNGAPIAAKEHALIFVHGFLGDASTTWHATGCSDSFPALLASDSRLSDHEVFTFQYRTKQLLPPAIPNISAQLRFAVQQHVTAKKIVLIAHSMGGLVCMDYVIWLLENAHPQVRHISGLLLFGTPMTGVEWAKYAKLVLRLGEIKVPLLGLLAKPLTANKQITALTSGSQDIERLTGNWILRILNGGHPETNADQRAWFPVRVVSGNDDWVVKESSARGLYSSRDWINIDRDHIGMVKPADREQMSYQIATSFLTECRHWMSPQSLLKLRRQLDAISDVRPTKYITDWTFQVECEAKELLDQAQGFGLADCRPLTGRNCSYRFRLASPFVMFGIALGAIDAKAIWDDSYAFLHTIRLNGLPEDVRASIRRRFEAAITDGETGWNRLFDKVSITVRRDSTQPWTVLDPDGLEQRAGGLVRRFSVPAEASGLVGHEVDICISFKGLTPSAITNYTVSFPWLCDSFVFRLVVKDSPWYLVDTVGMKGTPKLDVTRDDIGIEYASTDLILPGSFLAFEWKFKEGER